MRNTDALSILYYRFDSHCTSREEAVADYQCLSILYYRFRRRSIEGMAPLPREILELSILYYRFLRHHPIR